jgi:hypothetical protein
MQLFNPDNEIGYQQTEIDGLVDLARQQYGKLSVSQHELGCTLLQIRDVVKARGIGQVRGSRLTWQRLEYPRPPHIA